ncbi:MAG: hypothetical protein ACI304_05050 [Lepagella sp.]
MFDIIYDALEALFEWVKDIARKVINGVLSFFHHVVDYFKGLRLRKGRDIPFIADKEMLADMIHQAPVKDVGIFEATYNEDTNEIENYRLLEADELDERTEDLLEDEKLVVLT